MYYSEVEKMNTRKQKHRPNTGDNAYRQDLMSAYPGGRYLLYVNNNHA